MTRGVAIAIAGMLIGFALGRVLGTETVELPDPDRVRSAAEMETAVEEVLAHPLASVRAMALARLFEGMTPENAPGAARAVSGRAGRWDPIDLQIFLASWVRIAPRAALEEIKRWPIQTRRELGLRIAIREWAAGGGWLDAVEYVQSALDPELREVTVGPLVRGWALSGDFRGAERQARRLYEAADRADVIDGLVRGILHVGGPEAVLRVARDRPLEAMEDPFDRRLARVSLDLVVREDPAAAAAYFASLSEDGTPGWLLPMIPRMAEIWRNQDSVAALAWLLSLESDPGRDEAVGRTMADWAIRDLDAAVEWLDAHLAGLGLEEGEQLVQPHSLLVVGVLPKLSRVRSAAAAERVVLLPDGPGRLALMRRVARQWSIDDPAAADAWVSQLDVTEAQRAQLRAAMADRGEH